MSKCTCWEIRPTLGVDRDGRGTSPQQQKPRWFPRRRAAAPCLHEMPSAQHKLDHYHQPMFSVPMPPHMLELLPAQGSQLAEYAAGKPSTIPLRSLLLTYWPHVSVIGFLFGFSLASSFAAYRLLDEYKLASATLQASVEELQQSTEKACGYLYF